VSEAAPEEPQPSSKTESRRGLFGGLWRHADFLRLWSAQALSAVGSRVTRTVLPMLAILTLRASPMEIAILGTLSLAPGVIVGLFAGGPVDRAAKRPLMIASDLLRALILFSVPVAAWFGALGMPQLYLVAALVGAASTLFTIADGSYLPVLIAPEDLVEGNAKLKATDAIAEYAGPSVAGPLVQLLTAPGAILVDVASYLWSALLLSRIRTRPALAVSSPEAPSAGRVLEDIAIGYRACLTHPLVGPNLIAEAAMFLFTGFYQTLYMLIMLRPLGFSPSTAGLVVGIGGIGAFLGSLLAAPLGRRLGAKGALVAGAIIAQGASLLVPLSLTFPKLGVLCLGAQQLLGDTFFMVYAVQSVSLRQRELASEVLGRANATFQANFAAVLTAGALIAGWLTGTIGIAATAWIASIGALAGAAVLLPLLGGRASAPSDART
jgi:MFS family permease